METKFLTDISQMTSRFAEIIPPCHRRGKRVFSAANRSPDFSVFLCPEGHLLIFSVVQTHTSCRFHLAIDFLGLCRSGSSSQIIDQAQDFPEQFPRHRHLGQLERDSPAMADHRSTNLDQLLAQGGQRPMLHRLRRRRSPLMAMSGSSEDTSCRSACDLEADIGAPCSRALGNAVYGYARYRAIHISP